jgi:hypothetical protein
LHTRPSKYKHLLEITTQGGKGKVQPIKKQKFHNTSQQAWAYLEEPTTPHLSTHTPNPKGKSYGKGKSKGGKGKGFGKGLVGKGKPLFVPKGKGKGKQKGKPKGGKGKRIPKGNPSYEDLHRDSRRSARKPQVHQQSQASRAISVTL